MISQFRGILISGCFLFRVVFFAFFAVSNIRIPVIPPEMTPPTPRIRVKLMNSSWVMMMYRISGAREVNRKFFVLDSLMSYLNVSRRE